MHAHALLVLGHVALVASDVAALTDETGSVGLLLLRPTLVAE